MTSRLAVDIASLGSATGSGFDQFGRLRTSEPYLLFDGKTLFDKQGHYWDEELDIGTTCVFKENEASVELSVLDNVVGTVIRQTKQRFYYQPAKSQQILISHVFGEGGTGITKRIGYFDENNGIFFEQVGNILNMVIRSFTSGSVVERRIPQTDWNLNTLINTLDITKSNIFFIEFEWLGVGDVMVGFVIANEFIKVHQFRNSNVLSTVYMSNPNQPVRYEISNDGNGLSNSFQAICCSVIVEGGLDPTYHLTSADLGTNSITVTNVLTKLIAFRPKNNKKGVTIFPYSFSISTTANDIHIRYALIKNPNILTNSYVFTDIDNEDHSHAEVDINTTNPPTISGGELIFSGYSVGKKDAEFNITKIASRVSMGWKIDGTADIFVLAAQRLDAAQGIEIFASITLQEI